MHSESLWVAVSTEGWRQSATQSGEASTIGAEGRLLFQPQLSPVLAQEQFEQDILADLGNAVTTFIESGQVWALIIGFVLGYVLRGVTTYR